MNAFEMAIEIEKNSIVNLTKLMQDEKPELKTVFEAIVAQQKYFIAVLAGSKTIEQTQGKYPEIATDGVFDENNWQQAVHSLLQSNSKTEHITSLWMMYTVIEKSCQFYQQAGANTVFTPTKLFLSSLSQLKSLQRRRLDALLRTVYNEMWEAVGFAPVLLGKG